MTTTALVERDERTIAIENAAFRWSYRFLSFGVLVDVALRAWHGQASWDLFALVVLAGSVNAAYQAWKRVIFRQYVVLTLATMAVAAVIAALVVVFRR